MNALYDAPSEAEEAAYLDEFELGLVAECDDPQDAPSPWIARACIAGALAAHVGLVSIVLGTGLGWSFPHRSADFARIVDVEIEPRLPRMERVAVPNAPEATAGIPVQDRLALKSDAPEEAAGVPARDRLALKSALDALAVAGEAETLETIASNLNAETDAGAGALPAIEGEPSEIAASGPPINVAQGAESPVVSSPPALSLSLPSAPDLAAKSDMRDLAEARDRPSVVANEVAEDAVVARPPAEQVREPSIAQARPGDAGETVIARTEPEAAEGEAEQGSAEDADVQAVQAAEARRAAARKAANERARAADTAKKAAADRARAAAAVAARKRNEEARRREAEKRKVAAKKKSQAGSQANKQGAARRYAGMVRARVAARKPGLKGPSSVRVAYAVAPNGSLRYAKIAGANNSGFFMNQSSLAAVRRAAPFPPPPAGMSPGQLSFTVTFTYR